MTPLTWMIIIMAAYLLGAVPFAFLIAKAYGKDLRQIGSGNIGATNLARGMRPQMGLHLFRVGCPEGVDPDGGRFPDRQPPIVDRHRAVACGGLGRHSRARLSDLSEIQGRQGRVHQSRRRAGHVALPHTLRRGRPAGVGGGRPEVALHLAGFHLRSHRVSGCVDSRHPHDARVEFRGAVAASSSRRRSSHCW